MDIMTAIDTIVRKLERAQRHNSDLQSKVEPGSPAWVMHETVDECLHEAIAALGQ